LNRLETRKCGGPSGWTYEHVKLATTLSDAACGAVHDLVNLILAGCAPHGVGLLNSSFIGKAKPDGGARPIAIGEVFDRLAVLCALATLPAAGEALAQLQLSVGVSGGCKAVAHAVGAGMLADCVRVTLSLDTKNAFNMLAAAAEHVPCMLPIAQWAYGAPSTLHLVGTDGFLPLVPASKVRQGDPLGPYFLALTLQAVLVRVEVAAPDVGVVAIADDVYLQAHPESMRIASDVLRGPDGVAAVGLALASPKCAIYGPPPTTAGCGARHQHPEQLGSC
jgi:hypothetical protein